MTIDNTLWMIHGNYDSLADYTVRKGWEKTNRSICKYCEHSSERYYGDITVEWDKGYVVDYDILFGLGGHVVVKKSLYDNYFKGIAYKLGSVKFIKPNGKLLVGANNYVEAQFPIVSECAIDVDSSTAKIELCKHCGTTTNFKILGVEEYSRVWDKAKKIETVRHYKIKRNHGLIIRRQIISKMHAFQLRCGLSLFCDNSVKEQLSQLNVKGVEFLRYGLIR